jgi:Tfp pilus assembly protein PilO
MTRILLWLIVAAVLVIGFLFYRSQPRDRLNVTSYAEREIERAKRR